MVTITRMQARNFPTAPHHPVKITPSAQSGQKLGRVRVLSAVQSTALASIPFTLRQPRQDSRCTCGSTWQDFRPTRDFRTPNGKSGPIGRDFAPTYSPTSVFCHFGTRGRVISPLLAEKAYVTRESRPIGTKSLFRHTQGRNLANFPNNRARKRPFQPGARRLSR